MELDPQLENLLIRAAGMGASDLHLTVGIPPAVRVNNELIILEDESKLLPADTERLLLGIMDEDHLAAFRTEGEVDFAFGMAKTGRFRVNVYRQRGTMSAAIRVMSGAIPKPEELLLPQSVIDLTQKQSGLVLVTGPTGSGKSTLMSLLMRMWNPPVDAISVSGHPIETVPLSVLRGSIAYVPQESFLFSDSILNNIIFYDERITEDDAKAAAKAAAIHDNICEFPDQYATTVGERGMTLSGGQKQRVSIARALARKPELLLLDDCLSAVDAETERIILANLRDYLKGCTTIIVTHRIAVAGIADRVLLLNEDGSMAAIGTHSELSANCPEYQHLLAILEASKDGAAK